MAARDGLLSAALTFSLSICSAVVLIGCNRGGSAKPLAQTTAAAAPATPADDDTQATAEPSQIELTDPRVALGESNLVSFAVKYRFTQGKPNKYYMCEISFPGTSNQGNKQMDSWELKSEGTIKDGIILSKPPVEKFSIRVLEADSPQNGYHPISNIVSGQVQ